jgi:hypothetical protein
MNHPPGRTIVFLSRLILPGYNERLEFGTAIEMLTIGLAGDVTYHH